MTVHVLIGDQWVPLGALVEFLDLAPDEHVIVRGPPNSPTTKTTRAALATTKSAGDGRIAITRDVLDAVMFAWRRAASTPAEIEELVAT